MNLGFTDLGPESLNLPWNAPKNKVELFSVRKGFKEP